ncbi:MAG TPA: M20/M25/M40 family metallo-hydrolase, partial [Planctomycetota bacterium]|nr:M20/M25/M40 family metallo-hydrolase [Planctomycetota bacterium]
GGWFQRFTIPHPRLAPGNRLEATADGKARDLKLETDWNPCSVSPSASAEGRLVFAGYGIARPDRSYDDFAGIDVKGKVVLVIRRQPWAGAPSEHATFLSKLGQAREHGAAALLLVNDAKTADATGDRLLHWSAPVGPAPGGAGLIPFAFVRRGTAAELLRAGGLDLDALERGIAGAEGGPKPASAEARGVDVRITTGFEKARANNARNVAGLLEGSDPGCKDEIVILGAHHDHVGRGWAGSAAPREAGSIHPGADDNASGTAALLEIAEALVAAEKRPRRSVLFLSFSGEELGLLGSLHYVKEPLLPLATTVAMVNCDMVGRYDAKRTLEIGGVGTAAGLKDLVATLNAPYDLELSWDPQGLAPSDSTSFFRKRIPVLFFFTGIHPEYHTPRDTWTTLNYEGGAKVALLCRDVVREIADRKERLAYTDPPKVVGGRAILGITPGPGADGDGVTIAELPEEGPAAAAGLREGDVITAIGAVLTRDVRDLRKALASHKPGDKVLVKAMRNGAEVSVEVTLGSGGR